MISFGGLIALTIAVGMVNLHSPAAHESGSLAIPTPPDPIVQNAKAQQDAAGRDEQTSDLSRTCMEPQDDRVCEMELELGEITLPR